jgi:hypothetical protein
MALKVEILLVTVFLTFINNAISFFMKKRINGNNNELTNYIQQIIFYLEYLRHQVIRHFYILKSFSMQSNGFLLKNSRPNFFYQVFKHTQLPD